jgi:hypothetical protein
MQSGAAYTFGQESKDAKETEQANLLPVKEIGHSSSGHLKRLSMKTWERSPRGIHLQRKQEQALIRIGQLVGRIRPTSCYLGHSGDAVSITITAACVSGNIDHNGQN